MRRTLFEREHEDFRDSFRLFLERRAVDSWQDWERAGNPPRSFWREAGAAGFLGFEVDPAFGGLGTDDFRYNAIVAEEVADSGTATDGFSLHNDIVAPYLIELTTPEQRQRWLPGFVAGETITAIAMTEPQAGSDLAAIRTRVTRDGDELVLSGAKTFITNGSIADLVVVLAKNDNDRLSLVVIEDGAPGLSRGRPLAKVGRKGQDTAEIFLDSCRVPMNNQLGAPDDGLALIKRNLPRERLSIAVHAVANAARAVRLALEHTAGRTAFGGPLAGQQAIRHTLAEMHTSVQVARSHVDACVAALVRGELSAEDAAGAKLWASEVEGRVVDDAVQLFGGYGYMEEYPIARMWRDARVQRIYGGTSEIMRETVGRALVHIHGSHPGSSHDSHRSN